MATNISEIIIPDVINTRFELNKAGLDLYLKGISKNGDFIVKAKQEIEKVLQQANYDIKNDPQKFEDIQDLYTKIENIIVQEKEKLSKSSGALAGIKNLFSGGLLKMAADGIGKSAREANKI